MNADWPLIDAQVHAYERNHPGRPWIGHLHGPPEVTGEQLVAAMDAVGVDGALLVSPWSMYRYDASYACAVQARHPGRFALIKPFDHHDPAVGEQVTEWSRQAGAVGARIVFLTDAPPGADDPGIDAIVRAASAHELPVNILCWGHLAFMSGLARRHPHARLVLDHLGLRQHFEQPPPAHPFAALDEVLALAGYDNVAIKITGAGTLSHQAFPYADIWDPIARVIEAYGIERCLWGTDWTRATAFLSFAEGVDAFRLNERLTREERGLLMGGNTARLYRWQPRRPPS